MRIFDWPITKKFLKFGGYPTIEVFTPNTYTYESQYSAYYLQEDKLLGKSIWDKVRCYCNHVEEHIESLENMLRTHWELGLGDKMRIW